MKLAVTAETYPAPASAARRGIGKWLAGVVMRAAVIAVAWGVWTVRSDKLYTPASDIGYWLGVTGGLLMLVLLVYPLRKRYHRALAMLGPLKHWFRFHLVAGIAGPAIVLFHSTFRVGSFNAGIALASMLLVVASGIAGRFIYRKIHHGLYGSRATEEQLQRMLTQQLAVLQPILARLPAVEAEINRYFALATAQPAGRRRRMLHFATLGLRRHLTSRRVRKSITACSTIVGAGGTAANASLRRLADTIDETLKAVQRTAQFSTYDRLFSLWHVIHVPFLVMLVVTAIVHVVAVHAY